MKKRLISIVVVCTLIFGTALYCAGLDPVKPTTVYAEAELEELEKLGIVDGFEDGLLHPEKTLTRAQFAKILDLAFPCDITEYEDAEFADVSYSHWAYDCINRCVERGWLEGYPDGNFCPDKEITFEQAITVICRALELTYYDSYPESYLSAGMDYGISDGVNSVIGEQINRGQAAKIVVNSLEYLESLKFENEDYDNNYGTGAIKGAISGGLGGGGSALANAPAVMTDSADVDMPLAEESKSVYFEPASSFDYGYNNEEYVSNDENVFKNPIVSPLSTFSIDTDTASYSNLRRFILNGQHIPDGAVRIEELINYFDYQKAEIDENVPFGVNYVLGKCPWNEENLLAMLTVSGEELTERKPSNLVFLIDVSGSMYSYNKLPLVKQALSMLLDTLGENDKISIVTYASGTAVVLEPTPATEKDKITNAVKSLRAGGGTFGESGIRLAYEQAEKFKTDGNNRIILCTDGDFNIGMSSDSELENLISQKRESGIFLSVLGFGMGNYKDAKMEILADNGNGNYAYIDNMREAKKVLVDEMPKTIYTIAKDVKIQVEFNPSKVKSYRLVGYENRILNAEDFENDKKDAGELGAGANVTVLYEIVPNNGEVEDNLEYQDITLHKSDELMNLKIRFKEPDGNESTEMVYPLMAELSDEPGDDFEFAASVAGLGMIINKSEYVGSMTYDKVVEMARNSIGEDKFGIRCEFVQLADLLRYKENIIID